MRSRLLAALSPIITVIAFGCGSATPGPAAGASSDKTASSKREPSAAAENSGAGQSARVPSEKLIDRRARTAVAPDTLGLVKSSAAPPKTSAELYRTVAPATVIVRVPNGLGSGVIVDPNGWVLTNHHVIEHGESTDFKKKVSVLLGTLSTTTGGMVRGKKAYDAYVYKSDKLRDLALIKLEDPPKKLPFVRIAAKNPVPGQQVHAIGHAGAGMLWALKAGEISALGKLSEELATLARFKDDDKGKEAAESFKKYLEEKNLGLVIQSTCNILPGDSGGPLVTQQGELIGLNAFSNRDGRTGGLLSFHVHREEVANFLKDRPKKPAALVPDAWKDGGGDASYEDVDLDGRVDALLLQGRRPCSYCPRQSAAVFVDVDQDGRGKGQGLSSLTDVFEKRAFDAEIVYLQLEKDAFVWYDADNDGHHELLFVDTGTTGRTSAAYRVDKSGELNKDDSLASGRVIRPSLLKDAALRPRMGRIASAAFPARYLEASTTLADTLPEPIGETGEGLLADLDFDGTRDALRVNTAFSSRLLLDVDQNTAANLPSKLPLAQLKSRSFDPEVSVVSQSTHMWVWYDTNDDGRFDLVLHSPSARLYVAADAFTLDASGNQTPAPLHIGRKLIRPQLLNASMAPRLSTMVKKSFLTIMSAAEDDGLASFPDPVADHRGAGYELIDKPGMEKMVVVVSGQGSDGYLVDLDKSSLANRNKKTLDLKKLVKDNQVSPEFAYFQRNGLAWAYYDTDNRGGYDVVLYSDQPRAGKAKQGFRIDRSGKVSLDPALTGQALASSSLFKHKLHQTRFKKLAKELFGDRAVE